MSQDVQASLVNLARAYRTVLGDGFEESFRAVARMASWYSDSLSAEEVFRLWVFDHVDAGESSTWVFDPIRGSERPILGEALGVSRDGISGLSPEQLANVILDAARIALPAIAGRTAEVRDWENALTLILENQDERASVRLRALSERLLKKLLYFACSGEAGRLFLQVLRKPGNLRIPHRFREEISKKDEDAISGILRVLTLDDAVDLGFLVLALGKLESALATHPSETEPAPGTALFSDRDQVAFLALASALQSYTHDQPGRLATRKAKLLDTARSVVETVHRMADLGVLPDEGLVREVGESILGPYFRVQNGKYRRALVAEKMPALLDHIMYVADSPRDFSHCRWTQAPWAS